MLHECPRQTHHQQHVPANDKTNKNTDSTPDQINLIAREIKETKQTMKIQLKK